MALALSPTAAHAEKLKTTDASGDVVQFSEDFASTSPAPDDQSTDILKSTTNYSKHRVTVKLKLRDLTSAGFHGAFADIKTNQKRYSLSLFKDPEAGSDLALDSNGAGIKCQGKMKKKISASRDLIKMSVPSSCLGNPRWIRISVATLTIQESGTLADDALRTGLKPSGNLTFSSKLKRA